ncbi:isoleucine--tRNA ligase [bacterium (Candidatus Howlettbacteria) CG_4_10_14_0_8_um_filter_40_9]|nr:MAG: isoleucine--tRNA ligase [bacterium (Candidatus Howlettbacteria) CG_4_10_14_0_8_um_filter_40_9]
MFKKINQKQNFPELEKNILKFWKNKNIFKKSVEARPLDNTFSFYDGPPFATGTAHYGHLLAGTMKDVIPRFKTMQGYRVERVWGWDTHGLPIENIVEQELDFKSKTQIKEYGIDKFNEKCETKVLGYAEEWKKIVEMTGRWVDMENAYLTMDKEYMESVWWVFKSLWDKKLIYEGHKVMPYCPRCATSLSNFELGLGYKDKRDKAITVKFELEEEQGTYVLAWTTTPWTLPGNLALAVNSKIDYVKVKKDNEFYILAKDRLADYAEELGSDTEEEIKGKALIGKKYKPIFNFYQPKADPPRADKNPKKAFEIVSGDFVSTESGTGVVHIAPAFGENDYLVAKENGIDFFMPVDDLGNFDVDVPDYAGKSVIELETNEQIIKDLEKEGKVVKGENLVHSYPHCWRCDTPLIYRAVTSFFVDVKKNRDRILNNNKKIHWVPENIGKGRFQNMLEGAPDWNISRQRFWGTPLPVWKCEKCDKAQVFGSIAELEENLGNKKVTNLHLHKIQDLEISCDCGGKARLLGDVLDCWFESGSMPYASIHYPFENKEKFERDFPADFIAEGIDQTRGWFNSLLILSSNIFSKESFRNVIVNGTVLAENGQKMSKRLKNYPDPLEMVHKFGADAMRFYLMDSPAVRAEDLRFSEKGVDEVVKKIVITLWNTYSFFVTYASIDEFEPKKSIEKPKNKMDHWVLSELNSTVKNVTESLENFELNEATKELASFLDNLSNWYVRRSRRRFWKSENDADKNEAYQTLYDCLVTYSKLLAPYMPFVAEEIYKNLTGEESVHLSDWPKINEKLIDETINKKMARTRAIVNFGLSARSKQNIKVRQPLSKIIIFSDDDIKLDEDLIQAVKDELNVKEIEFKKDDPNIVEKIVKLDFTVAGPKYGPRVKEIGKAVIEGKYEITENGVKVGKDLISYEEVLVNFKSKSEEYIVEGDGLVLVALDINITEELKQEGIARDVVRIVQDLRKKADLDVSDRINISLGTDSEILKKVFEKYDAYIRKETLAEKIDLGKTDGEEVEIEKETATIKVEKV